MNKTKFAALIFVSILMTLLFAFSTQAVVFWACFNNNEIVNYCDYRPSGGTYHHDDETCTSQIGCMRCMSIYDPALNCYVHGSWPNCMQLPQECANVGGNSSIDTFPPILDIINPKEDNSSIFKSTSVLLDYTVNEKSDIYYSDLKDPRERFIRICDDCTGHKIKSVRFKEGNNTIRIRAADMVGNKAETDVFFIVDSKAPVITKTEPKSGFADGTFSIDFTEDNPDSLILNYGNSMRQAEVDLDACTAPKPGKMSCSIYVDLQDFNQGQIHYWFNLTDIAGSSKLSKDILLNVDTSAPVVTDLDYEVDGKNVHFLLQINELNLDDVSYIDLNDSASKWRSICSKLVNGVCEKTVTFSDGFHHILFNVTDLAGNHDTEEESFHTDSAKPQITSTQPKSGFADGTFDVTFREANPTSLILHYGNAGTGFGSDSLDLVNDCIKSKISTACDTNVDLSDYHNQTISYWFNLTDVLGQWVSSKPINLKVDTVAPDANFSAPVIDGTRVIFHIEVDEENFDSVDYRDNSASSPKFKTLCSSLSGGVCHKTLAFTRGTHNVDLQVTDDAGNAVGQNFIIIIV